MTAPELVVSAAIRATPATALTPVSVAPVEDGGHRPFGVLRVEPIAYGFRIWHDELEALGDATVTADETLARVGITPGASWALDHVDVTHYRNGARVPLAEVAVPYANVWVHLTGYRPVVDS